MQKFVQNIRDKIAGQKNALIYVHYRFGEFLQTFIEIPESRPDRDEIWVEKTNHSLSHRAVRYGIWRNLQQNTLSTSNHLAHLRHACSGAAPFFLPIYSPYGIREPGKTSQN